MISRSTIVRMNDAEAKFLTGIANRHRAAATLRAWGPQVAIITMGARGCFVQTSRIEGTWPGFPLKPLDTTGCGDAFFAAIVHGIAVREEPPDAISLDGWDTICRTANAAGALTALKPGAADAIPSVRTIRSLARSRTRRLRL
jgi:fructokinase